MHGDCESEKATEERRGQDKDGAEDFMSQGSTGSRECTGSQGSGIPRSLDQESRERDSESVWDRVRSRHPPSVLQASDVDNAEVEAQKAFSSGDPRTAWRSTQKLITLCHALQKEAASARYKANYGTSVCEQCDGLKAGPEVAATCFQLKQCYYTNLKVGADKKQARLIERLSPQDPNGDQT